MSDNKSPQLEQYADTPQGWQERLNMEMDASKKELEAWQKTGESIVKAFRDEDRPAASQGQTRLNLFTANVKRRKALLYGKTPKADVSRRYADADDDVARVAAEMLERVLNLDIDKDDDGFAPAMEYALFDRLTPGLGFARLRLTTEFETVDEVEAITDDEGNERAPAVPQHEELADADVETVYVHWKDVRWSPARTFHELRWVAFRVEMSRTQLEKHFGKAEELGFDIPLNAARADKTSTDHGSDAQKHDPWQRAEVWEVWDKEHRCVWWWVAGCPRVLAPQGVELNENGSVPDPLDLDGFWPFPKPMIANPTTSTLVPRADRELAKDLYEEIDNVSSRITLLEQAVRVVGAYDGQNEELSRVFREADHNEMIPVKNFAKFSEAGGFKGSMDFVPLDMIVAALDKLREYRSELITLAGQITGEPDVMRGEETEVSTATATRAKSRFASIEMQELQTEFARFASDTQKIKKEIICKHFTPEMIAERSNIKYTQDGKDPELVQKALQLITGDRHLDFRVQVRPEQVAMEDYSAQQSDADAALASIVQVFQAGAPVMQMAPQAAPLILELVKWRLARTKGSQSIEGIVDRFIAQAEQQIEQAQQQPQQQQPNPEVQKMQMQMQLEQKKAELKAQSDAAHQQLEVAGERQRIDMELDADRQKQGLTHSLRMQEMAAQQRHATEAADQKAEHQAQAQAAKAAATPAK